MTPKLFICSSHASGEIDPTMMANLFAHLPNRVASAHEADAVIVVVGYSGDYRFNEALRSISKPIILVDLLEYFGFCSNRTHLFGIDELPPNMLGVGEWGTLDEWVKHNPPALYFKRELWEADRHEKLLPIEWPCVLDAWAIESKEAFDRRPFQLYYSWGYSNPIRPRLASEIYELMADGLIEVIASHDHIDAKLHETNRRWVSVHVPHTHRLPIGELMRRQAQSKMSVSLPGSGRCCFRSTEAPLHTVPVMLDDGHAWSHPWIEGENCIRINEYQMGRQLERETQRDDLHPIYVAAQENLERYRTIPYINNYILPAIERVL